MKKYMIKFNKWVYRTFIGRYLLNNDTDIVSLFNEYESKRIFSVSDAEFRKKKHNEIMEVLTSEKYKQQFYAIVDYHEKASENTIQPHTNKFLKTIYKYISLLYLYVFNRKLYNVIRKYRSKVRSINSMDSQIDKYMSETTVIERIDRSVNLGVLPHDIATSHKRLHMMKQAKLKMNE